MYISAERLDDRTVLIVGYDPSADPKWELCAVFESLQPENTARLISRHRRRHFDRANCESLSMLTKRERDAFDEALPRFYAMAMKAFGFVPFDDSLPAEQKDLPFKNDPQK